MLGEDFDTTVNRWGWKAITGTEPGNRMEIVPSALHLQLDVNGDAVASIEPYMDLRENEFRIEVDRDVQVGDIELALVSESFPQNELRIAATRDNRLRFSHGPVGQVGFEKDNVPYNVTEHRYWRIARTGDTVTWETSSDNVTFANHGTQAGLPWATFMRPLFVGRKFDNTIPIFTARMHNIN